MRARSVRALRAIGATLAVVGRKAVTGGADGWLDEALLALALTLVTVGLWPRFGVEALVAPGLVLLWIFLPARTALIGSAGDPATRRKG